MMKALLLFASLVLAAAPINKSDEKTETNKELGGDIHLIKSGVNVDSLVKVCSADYLNPTEEQYYGNQSISMNHIGDIETVWNSYRGEGTTIAFVDTGINIDHEDFNVDGVCRVSTKSRSYYHSGSNYYYADIGANYQNASYLEPNVKEDGSLDYHGDYVSGTAAAKVNGVGTVGIAPEAEILMVKIDQTLNSLYDGIKYAADCGATVISVSQGVYDTSTGKSTRNTVQQAVDYATSKGSIVVAAAGNDTKSDSWYPAACTNVIGVGALAEDSSDTIADYSNFNKSGSSERNVDVVAPGTVFVPAKVEDGVSKYGKVGGTSFSTPIVAGAIALYKQKFPSSTLADVEEALFSSCVDLGTAGFDLTYGNGALDVKEFLKDKQSETELTVYERGTKIYWKDELGWNFRTLHMYDLEFADGYTYADFERYMSLEYGDQVNRNSYNFESENGSWCANVPGRDGDYLLTTGQTGPEYYVQLPYWVTGVKYQFVNNNNWVNDDKCDFDAEGSFLGENKSYIYDDNGNAAVSTVDPVPNYTAAFPGVAVQQHLVLPNGHEIYTPETPEYVSIYEHYSPAQYSAADHKFKGFYLDANHQTEYEPSYMLEDGDIYAMYVEYPAQFYFEDQGWADTYMYQKIQLSETSYYEPLGPFPGLKMDKLDFDVKGKGFYVGDICYLDGYSMTLQFSNGSQSGSVNTTYVGPGKYVCHVDGQWTTYTDNFNAGVAFIELVQETLAKVEGGDGILPGSVCGIGEDAAAILEAWANLDGSGQVLAQWATIETYNASGTGMEDVSVYAIVQQIALMAAGGSSMRQSLKTPTYVQPIVIVVIAMMVLTFLFVISARRKLRKDR